MKNIILTLVLLSSINAFAQVDSATLRSGKLSLRINDWEYIAPVISFNNAYEDLYDSIKNRLRPLSNVNYPSGTTVITIDSVTNGELNALCYTLKMYYNRSASATVDRILTAIRSISTYTTFRQDVWDADELATFNSRRTLGKNILRKR